MSTKCDMNDYVFHLISSDNVSKVIVNGSRARISQLLVDLHELNISTQPIDEEIPSIKVNTPHNMDILMKIADFCRRFHETPFEPLQKEDMMDPIYDHSSDKSLFEMVNPKIPRNIIESPLIRDLTIGDLITQIYPSEKHDAEMYSNSGGEQQIGQNSDALRANEGPWIQYARYFQIDILENLLEYFIYYFLEQMTPATVCKMARMPVEYAMDVPNLDELRRPQGERPFHFLN
jgi:hypothetical protein